MGRLTAAQVHGDGELGPRGTAYEKEPGHGRAGFKMKAAAAEGYRFDHIIVIKVKDGAFRVVAEYEDGARVGEHLIKKPARALSRDRRVPFDPVKLP